jgi:hypothetical protein
VYFVDAAHFVFAPFLGCLWCAARLFVRAASGRKRHDVPGAFDAATHRLIRVTNGILSIVVDGEFQAAGFSLIPSMNLIPRTTSVSSGEPFNDRQPFDALSISLNTIVRHATRLPLPLVLS